MPWEARTTRQEKKSFIMEWLSGQTTMVELCESFNISRTLGYRYVNRYRAKGWKGLEASSRTPLWVWNKTPSCVEKLILELKDRRPSYGARTIHGFLVRSIDSSAVPGVSTIDLMLKRHGLVKKHKRVRRIREIHPKFHAAKPNEIWSADFKGQFRMRNMRYCYPLTIMDAYSRYVLAIVGMHRPTFEGTKAVFEALFEEYGLPEQIHTDNGEPFASAVSLSRLTHLAVWFIELGIMPVYSDPAHPEQNGSHERMHKDLKAAAAREPGASLGWQQKKFDAFRLEHNEVRPHQSLEDDTPQERYYRSAKQYDGTIQPWQYPEGIVVKYVCRNGAIRWGNAKWITVSTTLKEKYIGLEQIAEGKWRVYYRNVLLGYLDEKEMRILDDEGRFRRNKKIV